MDEVLAGILRDHQAVGAIGRSASVEALVEQSLGFLEALGGVPPGAFVVDLGAGGGVPALPIVVARPDLHFALVERRGSRAGLLRGAVRRLGAESRVHVIEADARTLGPLAQDACFGVARCAGPATSVITAFTDLVVPGSVVAISAPPGGGVPDPVAGWVGPTLVPVGRWSYLRWSRA